MSSRGSISARQRNANFCPAGTIAQHILRETQVIDSDEKVLELPNGYWVASKFYHRFYRVVVENGQWFCSATDERVAAACKAMVQAYLIRKVAEEESLPSGNQLSYATKLAYLNRRIGA